MNYFVKKTWNHVTNTISNIMVNRKIIFNSSYTQIETCHSEIKHTLPCDSKCFLQFIQSSFIFPLSFSSLFYLIHFISSFLSYLPKIGAELHHFPVQRIENQLAKMNFLERTNGWMMMPRQIKKPCVGTRPSNAYSPPYHIHMHPHCYMQLYV